MPSWMDSEPCTVGNGVAGSRCRDLRSAPGPVSSLVDSGSSFALSHLSRASAQNLTLPLSFFLFFFSSRVWRYMCACVHTHSHRCGHRRTHTDTFERTMLSVISQAPSVVCLKLDLSLARDSGK